MSLFTDHEQNRHAESLARAEYALKRAARYADSDCQTIAERTQAKGLRAMAQAVFGRWLRGDYVRENRTLTYTLLRDEVALDLSYMDLISKVTALNPDMPHAGCRQAVCGYIAGSVIPDHSAYLQAELMRRYGRDLQASKAYLRLQVACAAQNMRLSLEVDTVTDPARGAMEACDYWVTSKKGIVATPRLVVRIYLDQEYEHQPPAASPQRSLG